jgi:hypothetical protein
MTFSDLLFIILGMIIGFIFTYIYIGIRRDYFLPPILQPSPAQKEDLNNFLKEQFSDKSEKFVNSITDEVNLSC